MDRKLKTEVDRALKSVTAGLETFDDIYEKVLSADTAAKKERAEMELKTQIKKLQKFRDQIKSWIASDEIREKNDLLNARKNIETRMETFKRAEKEAKTKAFSKEGLAQGDRLDPEEAAKQACREWVDDCLHQIREQRELVGADLEALQSKKGKKNKEEMEEIQEKLKQHTFHVKNLELVLRGLDNDVLNHEDVDALREDVEYYVNNNSEPDFINDEALYEPLDLEASLGVLGKEVVGEVMPGPAAPGGDSGASGGGGATSSSSTSGGGGENGSVSTSSKKPSSATGVPSNAANPSSSSSTTTSTAAATGGVATSGSAAMGSISNSSTTNNNKRKDATTTTTTHATDERPNNNSSLPGAVRRVPGKDGEDKSSLQQQQQDGHHGGAPPSSASNPPPLIHPANPALPRKTMASVVAGSSAAVPSNTPSPASTSAATAPRAGGGVTANQSSQQSTAASTTTPSSSSSASSSQAYPQQQPLTTPSPPLPPPPQSAPTSRVPRAWPANLDFTQKLAVLDASLAFLPTPVDSERSKLYVPHHPFHESPSQFPNAPAPAVESPLTFARLDLDSLFYAFFNLPHTPAQAMAAAELKKHQWRWNATHGVWMQRYEEPSFVGPEFEVGTYVYFDRLTWQKKVKTNFTFEYAKME